MELLVTDGAAPEGQLSVPPQADQQPVKDKHRHRSKSKSKHKHKSEKEGKEHRKKRKHRSRSRSRGEAPPPGSAIDQVAQDAAPAAAQVSESGCCHGTWHQGCMSNKHHFSDRSLPSDWGKASKASIIAEWWHQCCELSDRSGVALSGRGLSTTAIRGCVQHAACLYPSLCDVAARVWQGLGSWYGSHQGFGLCCTILDSQASLLVQA